MAEDANPSTDSPLSRREAVKTLGGLGLFGFLGSLGTYAEPTRAAHRRSTRVTNANHVFPRAPLAEVPYAKLPLGAVKPKGWLREQLERMAGGMAGRLDEHYRVVGASNAWRGGNGDNWERGPYWLDGLVPLAYTLEDQRLIDKAQPYIDWTLESQQASGYFGPATGKDYLKDPPGKSGAFIQTDTPADWWPRMVMLKVLEQHYEAAGDERVLPFMTRYFRYQLQTLSEKPLGHWTFWAEMRGGENQSSIYWLYSRTGEDFLLELARLVFRQTADWTRGFLGTADLPSTHAVNIAMAVKQPALQYLQTKDEKHLKAVDEGLRFLMTEHGQPQGMFSGDELLHGTAPTRGTEACTVVELMYSLEALTRITGSVRYLDHLERVAYNALPTQHTDDYKGRQYFQQPNQIRISRGRHGFITHHDDDLCYGLETGYPCCTTNMHQGWPKFTRHLWLATHDGGLAALQYAPSVVEAKVADGVEVRFEEETTYPFEEEIRFRFQSEEAARFPLHLRIPGWTGGRAAVHINGQEWSRPETGQVIRIERRWQSGDEVTLELPMAVRASRWHENAAAIERGPLVYALPVEGDWRALGEDEYMPTWTVDYEVPAWEVYPSAPWNYGLLFDAEDLSKSFEVVRDEVQEYPWNEAAVPVKLVVQGKRIPFWHEYNGMSGPLPPSPIDSDEPAEEVTLIPYGATTLRIAEIPVLRD